ncbi:hypothetical protein [Aquimarina celericrescens]|uniref:Uncharacterized protein n=1 Tax=Aquimarina celericrescens TaxID=1964542 RepID=A0ABW5B2E1_9FLAO|nr:hypothetical protein [Aquimarina celericrescens]
MERRDYWKENGLIFSNNSVIIARKYYSDKQFVYISYRINSYAVDPISCFEVNKISNLIAVAIISEDFKLINQSKIEWMFSDKELEYLALQKRLWNGRMRSPKILDSGDSVIKKEQNSRKKK